jgi:hypothetical protein
MVEDGDRMLVESEKGGARRPRDTRWDAADPPALPSRGAR